MPGKGYDNIDMPLADLMDRWPETIPVFLRHKMLCVGCFINPFHTLVDGCAEYSLDLDEFIGELGEAISGRT